MLSQKAAARHECNNASAAALILRNRTCWPLVMVRWAEACQRRPYSVRFRCWREWRAANQP
jgi:hypothetical protein